VRHLWLTCALAALLIGILAPLAVAQQEQTLEIDWLVSVRAGDGTKDNPYEIASGMALPIWAHLIWPGHEGEPFHIDEVSIDIWHVGGGDTTWDWQWIAEPCQDQYVCEWFRWGVLWLIGEPCNTVAIQADLFGHVPTGETFGPLYSNELYFHVVPEPAAFTSLAGLLLGVVSIGWSRMRRR
jgi:hypothetical protein